MKRSAAASLLAVALVFVAATPSHGWHGRVFIGGPVFWWGPVYPYGGYPQPYTDWAEVAEKRAMAQVRLTTEAALVSGCTRIGVVRDDSIKDLRRKIVRVGGNAGVLEFGIDDLSTVQAEVYRCTSTAKAPSNIPPPPAGAPPPPPPGPAR